jgi:hypothetical protein
MEGQLQPVECRLLKRSCSLIKWPKLYRAAILVEYRLLHYNAKSLASHLIMVRHNLEYPKDVHNTVNRYKHQGTFPGSFSFHKLRNL